jgi:signal-transduction protein with cAMP-binding, CBS, and nucleotidyltransferase domain
LPPVAWCWLALGSEGRHEQTFVTDQDNGLIFSAQPTARKPMPYARLFLPFAQEVNQRLADCGFKLCSGQIMAGNPAWCLSHDEWRQPVYRLGSAARNQRRCSTPVFSSTCALVFGDFVSAETAALRYYFQ